MTKTPLESVHGTGNGHSSSKYLDGRGIYLDISGLVSIRALNLLANFLIFSVAVCVCVCTASKFSPLKVIKLKWKNPEREQ